MFLLQADSNPIFQFIISYWWVLILLFIVFSGLFSINQGYIGVITMFGKYQRVVKPDSGKAMNWESLKEKTGSTSTGPYRKAR